MKKLLLALLAAAGLVSFAGCVVEPEHPRDHYYGDHRYDRDHDGDHRWDDRR